MARDGIKATGVSRRAKRCGLMTQRAGGADARRAARDGRHAAGE